MFMRRRRDEGVTRGKEEELMGRTGKEHPAPSVQLAVGGWLPASLSQASTNELATPSYVHKHTCMCKW